MGKTLVLVVDRDDDFGVKGKVNTPVVGVQNCLDAATSFGIADPEDSDLNALYAAISVCLELQEDGHEADVALICGDEKVGHRSDLALVAQLSEVLEQIEPDSVVLVGDGAEDEYIYPIISSRAHVDSVRKVYVKQAPGLEGTFYIVTKMLSDPDKRKRFLVPLGVVIAMLALFFLLGPDTDILRVQHDAASAGPEDRDHVVPRGPHHVHHLPADLRVLSDRHGRLLGHGDRRPVPEEQLAPRGLLHVRHGLAGDYGPRTVPGRHGHREADGQEGDRTVRHLQLSGAGQSGTRRVRCSRHHDVLHGYRIRAEHRRRRGHRRDRGLDSQQLPEGKGEGHLRGGRP